MNSEHWALNFSAFLPARLAYDALRRTSHVTGKTSFIAFTPGRRCIGLDASHLLGRPWLGSHAGPDHRPVWRQHFLRGSAGRRPDCDPGCRHGLASARTAVGGGVRRGADLLDLAADPHSLGPHPGAAVFSPGLSAAQPVAHPGL